MATEKTNLIYFSLSEPHKNQSKMSDGSGSEGETYEVEKILDKKIVKGKTQYFIKWKGEFQHQSIFRIYRLDGLTGLNREKHNTSNDLFNLWQPCWTDAVVVLKNRRMYLNINGNPIDMRN